LAKDNLEGIRVDVSAGELQHELDVLPRGERRDQVEELEHEADPLPPEGGASVLIQSRKVLPVNDDPPGAGGFDAADHVEQCGLPRTARSEDHHELPSPDLHFDPTDGLDGDLPLAIGLPDVLKVDREALLHFARHVGARINQPAERGHPGG
jgi:hypothetical protein